VAALPELTAGRLLTTWTLVPSAALVALALAGGYLACVRQAHRRGQEWSPARTAVFLLGGPGTIVVATMSCLAVYRDVLFWPAAVTNTVLAVITPVGMALGDPVGLLDRASPGRLGPRVHAALRGRLARFLTFPLVSALLGALTQFGLYFTPYFRASLRSGALHGLLSVQLVVTGLLFVVPLLGEDLLPAWCTHPVRAAITFVDGLVDAVPGMLLALTSTPVAGRWYADHPRSWGPTVAWDQTIGGALVFCLTEAVGAPLLVAVFVQWSRADAREAADVDRRLDREDARRTPSAPPPGDTGATPGASAPAETDRPWWETDPGPLRGRRYGRDGDGG
jgi:putative copper resistance protein D